MPNPIQTIRKAIYITSVVAHSGKKVLRLIVPIVSTVVTVIQEIKRKN